MKKRAILAITLSLVSCYSFSQTLVTQVKPAGSKKWGYATLDGTIIIQPQFDKCYEFSRSGLATIYDGKQRQYYFINLKGEKLNTEVKEFKMIDNFGFDLKGFEDGLVPIKQGDKWGYLNTEGKIAIPAKYDHVDDFNAGYAPVKLGEKFLIVDTQGNETPVDGSVVDMRKFSESLAPYRTADKKFGFIGTDGKIIVAAQFESVGYFRNGLAWAKAAGKNVGYINNKGEWIIKPDFQVAKEFEEESGLARIKTGDDKWAYVSKSGELTFLKGTDIYEDFSDGLVKGKQGGKFGFMNATGEWVIKPEFDGCRDFKNGYAAVQKDKSWGIIDKSGKWIIEPKFDGIKDMELVN